MREIPLMTANQEFSRLIKEVERGESFLISRRGRPVAKLTPILPTEWPIPNGQQHIGG